MKRKNLILTGLLAGALTLFGGICTLSKAENTVVTADTFSKPKYSVMYDYKHYYTYGSAGSVSTTQDGANVNVTSARMYSSRGSSTTVRFYLYNDSVEGEAVLAKDGAINFNDFTIEIETGFMTYNMTVTDSSGTGVGEQSGKKVTLSDLSDGRYTVTAGLSSPGWNPDGRSYAYYSATCSFSFIVDATGPWITGGHIFPNHLYTNTEFTITAGDNGVGLENLYMQAPNSEEVRVVENPITIPAGSVNGRYMFFAADKAGNGSFFRYVNYDSVAPDGMIKNGKGEELGEYTNAPFSYTATDSGSGIKTIEYMPPTSGSWESYTSGTVIPLTATEGRYSFRATDKAGNTDQRSIVFDKTAPFCYLYGGESVLASGSKTKAAYIKFQAEDFGSGIKSISVQGPGDSGFKDYVMGDKLTKNGVYTFGCMDKAGNMAAGYTAILDNQPPTLTVEGTEFFATTGQKFTVTANDDVSTYSKLYYKLPNQSSYAVYPESKYTVQRNKPDGKYYFYAEDDMGNRSSVVWVELSVEVPKAQIVRDDANNKTCVTWTEDRCTASLNGQAYTKGTWVTAEGSYSLILNSSATGRSATYSFSITHSYALEQVVNPSCTEQGYTIYKCITCQETAHRDFVPAIGHSYEEERIEADCINGGYTLHACTNCGDAYVTDETLAAGHKYTEQTVAVTCTERGGIQHLCVVCGYHYLTEIEEPSGHSYSSRIIKVVTCTENGERQFTCEKCGEEYTSVIPSFGHNYEMTEERETENGTERTYVCTVCGEEYTQELGDQYEKVSSYVEFLFQKYSPYMLWVFLGVSGLWSVVMGIMVILAHKHEEKEKAKKMLINYGIGMVVIFCILVACPYLVRGIAALVT